MTRGPSSCLLWGGGGLDGMAVSPKKETLFWTPAARNASADGSPLAMNSSPPAWATSGRSSMSALK